MAENPSSSDRPDPLHVAIAELEQEMTAAFARADVPSDTRRALEQRLRELKIKADVGS